MNIVRRFFALLAASLLFAQPAVAACSAANTYVFNFGAQAAATLSYTGSYTYTASNTLGATRTFTTSFGTNDLSTSTINGTQMPAIGTTFSGAAGGRTLNVGGTLSGRTASITANARTMRVTFTFAQPIRDLAMNVHDIDFGANQFRDWLHVSGASSAGTYVPAMSSPYGNNNGTGARTATGSSLRFGSSTTPYALSGSEALGVGDSSNTGADTGDVNIGFAQPVTSVTLRYGNYPFTSGESSTGQQGFGISTISFCPMPSIAVDKSSAPYATTGADRFNAPGSDVVYTITATNSGGSPVDTSTLALADALPAGVTFYNGDFNPLLPGSGPIEFTPGTSGVTMTGGTAYSNNGGTSYVYTPASGYDANVNAIRFVPTGGMAANSSFTIRFRARIDRKSVV